METVPPPDDTRVQFAAEVVQLTAATMDCKNVNCSGRIEAKGSDLYGVCPECRSLNCFKCSAIHPGLSCRQYQLRIRGSTSPAKAPAPKSTASPSPSTSALEKSPRQAPTPVPSPVVANGDDPPEKLVQCKVAGCDGQGFVDKEATMFRCPVCSHYNCLKCEAVHESMTCAEYQDNKDSVAPPVRKPNRQSEEDSEDVEDEDEQELEAADDDAEGMIVECRYEQCKGYAYVFKTATVAQCELCKHWTCVSCKACHESQSCAQYNGIDVPEENTAPESMFGSLAPTSEPESADLPVTSWTVAGEQRRGRNREKKSNSAGSKERGGLVSGMFTRLGSFFGANGSGGEEVPPAQNARSSWFESRTTDPFDPGTVSGARGHKEHKKVQEEGVLPCDACGCPESEHIAEECEHALCRKCIQKSVQNSTVYGSVSCPAKAASSQPCSGRLREKEIEQHVRRDVFKKLGKKSNWCDSKCFDERCSHAFRRKKGTQFFICPLCRRENCADCRTIHENMTCEQHIQKLILDMDTGKLEDRKEKMKRLEEQIALYEKPCLQTSEEFECPICLVEVEPGKGIVLRNCHHQICEQCLADTAKNSPVTEVLCPCKSDDADCQMPVLDSDLRACLSVEDYAALQERGLREAENASKEPSFHCKTPDCKAWCLYERDVEVFDCPVCSQRNCLRCEAIHKDMTCAEYQTDLKRRAENDEAARASLNFLEEILKTEQAMRCPQCRVVIIKRSGCDWMVCSCKTELCWATKGARWGPLGQGDISGGCRCGVNGRKCHPRCTTCH